MPRHVIFPYFAAIFFLSAGLARAHGIGLTAVVSGGEVVVDCGYDHDHKVAGGKVSVTDSATGEIILRGVTDAAGVFRFRPSDDFLSTGHGITVSVSTPDGHHADREIAAEELLALSSGAGAERHAAEQHAAERHETERHETERRVAGHTHSAGLDAAGLEEIVSRAVAAQLLPLRQEMARAAGGGGPSVQSIVGGLGWIAGLLGLAAYLKNRPAKK